MSVDEVIEKELVYIKVFVRDAPLPLFIAFRKEFEGLKPEDVKQKQKELYELYVNSADKNALAMELAMHGEGALILKPAGVRVFSTGEVVITTKGGSKLVGDIRLFGESKKEIANNLRDWMYVEVKADKEIEEKYGRDACLITTVDPLKGYVDEDEAKRLLDEYSLTPAELLMCGLGIRPCDVTMRLFLPRLLPLFYYGDRPIHVMQLTNVESGKTEYGTRLEFLFTWTFYSEFPSVAELIYDGRTGSAGSVFTSNGIVIDEIDKVSKTRFVEAYQPLNTGLENGLWRRGVSIHGRKLEVYRRIPFIVFGNVTQGDDVIDQRLYENSRATAKYVITEAISTGGDDRKVNVYSFIDRFAIVDVYPKYVPISDYVIMKDGAVGVLPDSTMRGIVSVVQDAIKHEYVEPTDDCKGRRRAQLEAVYNVLKALIDEEVDLDVLREIVVGNRDFGALFETEVRKEERAEAKVKDEEFEDIDFTLEFLGS